MLILFYFSYFNRLLLQKYRYDENGNSKGSPEFIPPSPTRLPWDLNHEPILTTIEDADKAAQKLIDVKL